jgi:hypothetical protein
VVGNPAQVQAGVEQFGAMEFESPPTSEGIQFTDTEILLSDETCLAVWSNVDASAIVGAQNDGVHVFVSDGDDWFFISQWAFRDDLWENDCQSQLP